MLRDRLSVCHPFSRGDRLVVSHLNVGAGVGLTIRGAVTDNSGARIPR